ncbi:unnamed protein product [Natator depressus]
MGSVCAKDKQDWRQYLRSKPSNLLASDSASHRAAYDAVLLLKQVLSTESISHTSTRAFHTHAPKHAHPVQKGRDDSFCLIAKQPKLWHCNAAGFVQSKGRKSPHQEEKYPVKNGAERLREKGQREKSNGKKTVWGVRWLDSNWVRIICCLPQIRLAVSEAYCVLLCILSRMIVWCFCKLPDSCYAAHQRWLHFNGM